MASLIVTAADGQSTELPLSPGPHRVGRTDDNDIIVPDASVSSHHAELHLADGQLFVRDLGSTNGTAINNAPVQEAWMQPGDTLRLGNIECYFQDDALPVPPLPATRMPVAASVAHSSITNPSAAPPALSCKNHPALEAKWECRKCGERYCETCIIDGRALGVPRTKFCPVCRSLAQVVAPIGPGGKARGQTTFAGEMAGAWLYPFRGEGSIIMIVGAICLTIASIGAGFLFIMGLLVYVLAMGYYMAYAEKVVIASADGDTDPPTWPEFSNYWDDILVPFGHAFGLFALYLLPVLLALFFGPGEGAARFLLPGVLLLLALLMMPMAWLAICMHSTIGGLTPQFVIPSILRIPGPYFLIFMELVVLVAIRIGIDLFLEGLAIPVVVPLVSSFFGIYFTMVICRLLGVMYNLHRDELGWRL